MEDYIAEVVNSKKVLSPGFIEFVVNEDKAKMPHLHKVTAEKLFFAVMVVGEGNQVAGFLDYLERTDEKRVLLSNLADSSICKVVKPSDASRYFPGGRRRIKAKIHHRLGRWYSCPGYLLSLTFAPDLISRSDAWRNCRSMGREFINRVNRWRKRHGMPRAKFLTCIEVQPGSGYPHLHFVFPYLKWLASIAFMTETWGQGVNAVDMKPRDSFSPVGYVCKYVDKLTGWSDVALSYIWLNRTRLYSMSRDYTLPDYSEKRVPEWAFAGCFTRHQLASNFGEVMCRYETVLGTEDIVKIIVREGLSP